MVEHYTKDLKESIYHSAVISVLAICYTMLGKTLIKMSPHSLGKFDVEDGVKLLAIVAISDFIKDYLTLRAPRVLVPTPSTKGGGGRKGPPSISRTRNATNLKPLEGLGVSFKVSKNFKLV